MKKQAKHFKLDIFKFLERRRALNLIKYNKKAQNSLGVAKEDYINLSRSIRKNPLKSIAFTVNFNSIQEKMFVYWVQYLNLEIGV